jgi:CheY-like chemotaxis protein
MRKKKRTEEMHNATQQQNTITKLKKVLIIDDSVQTHQAFKMMLNRYKCETITALNGQKAMNQLCSNPEVNLLIVDLNMQHMSGMEFIRRVKEQKTYDHIPIIAISSDGMRCDANEVSAFAQGNLRKPFTSSELHTIIETLFPQNICTLCA